ncbi:efflux RND transporter periplasmic adaptor subunit [Yoonia sp. F2084L]|uniref:efflux RND transporter periplasmic adaptor subunit n=1 Tax=Yoonia sp. F2084L TaxID=2926419 RepID=UPI001FF309EC|nr:efflux RND transporter periplasmic adaptor subunit [Yoonia sp. F2084L]MCK0094981.1 efflux RND transporter periplasmic adaptor subunit [Yoonia sp. F2084L]
MRLLVTFVIFLGVASFAQAQGRAASVGVQEVEMRALAETVPVFAEVTTARDGNVAGRVAGNVETVVVLAGTRVEKGDLLVELNDDLLTIQLAQSQAQLAEAAAGIETARARVDRARVALDRVEALRGGTSFSQGRFDDAQADFLEAEAQFVEAQAREKSAQSRVAETSYQLDRSQILAPFSGVVLEVNTIPGAFIQAGTPVVRLLDTDAFEVRASVPSRYTAFLQPGQIVAASTETGAELTLELRAVLPVEDPSTRTRAVLFAAPDLSKVTSAAVGQSLTVEIPVGAARDVLSVPKDALVQARGGWTVFVAADDQAQPRQVTLGVPLGDRYEVLGGLAPGDLVVVRGNERLRPGQAISANMVETN